MLKNVEWLQNKTILIINTVSLSIFCAVSVVYISLLSIYSGNILLEVYKWTQTIIIIFLLLYFIKNKVVSLIVTIVIYGVYLILINYFIFTNSELDYSFFARNIKDVPAIIPQFALLIIIVIMAAVTNSIFIYKFGRKFFKKLYTIPAIIFIVFPIITGANELNNELIYFTKSIVFKDKIIDYYQNNVYNNLLKQSLANKNNFLHEAKKIDKEKLPKYLDNIIILQMEGLNSFLVNKKNTPNFIEISKEGIFFPKFYGNSVQTIMAQENILCSLPSSFDMNLVESGKDKNILCLPEIIKNLAYKTFFIKSYNLKFSQTGKFMENIKFDEIHADDIMKPGDIKYPWGYREDIFYQRAFAYLEKNKKDKFNFFYIEIGPTNHWPFETPEDMKNAVPFKNALNHQKKLINTTFLQDQYLKIAWDEINKIFPEKNYILFILGDHSWPAEFHVGNTFNEGGGI